VVTGVFQLVPTANTALFEHREAHEMVTITLMGDLQTPEGERALECQVEDSITIKQLIRNNY